MAFKVPKFATPTEFLMNNKEQKEDLLRRRAKLWKEAGF